MKKSTSKPLTQNFSQMTLERVFSRFASSTNGISSSDAYAKTLTFGKNFLPEKKKNWGKMLLTEFTNPLVLILLGAVGISLLVPFLEYGTIKGHNLIEPAAILIILIFNALLGFFQELKAENTLAALKTLQPEETIVMRDGEQQKILAENLVPGDVVFLAEGEKIPADIRLIEAIEAKVNESLLTGESVAVYKSVEGKKGESPAETKNILFSGSQLISGRAKGIVIATGLKTEIGKIANQLINIQSPPTPLEQKLDILGKRIGISVIAICLLIFVLSFIKGVSFINALLTAVALAVGAIPEGLPAVMTISLAIGVSIMAKKQMLIRELKSVETLGSITVIASDKTGTITQNKMSVEEIFLSNRSHSGEFFTKEKFHSLPQTHNSQLFFEVLKNCNDAKLPNIGDPTEIGLLQMAENKKAISYERIAEIPFSSETKWMSTTHEISGEKYEFIKGAPEVIAEFCGKEDQKIIQEKSDILAQKGIRTIGIAIRKNDAKIIEFLGIAGLQDPARNGVKKAILDAKNAGIRTIMITGDHAVTAQAIAHKVGIESEVIQGVAIEKSSDQELQEIVKTISIYARVSPEHKVRICKALQANGEVVGMTGDGVNDAPAISQAQVGISMGKVGTSVARSASDMVLLDDDFSTIVRGIQEGRRIFSNIKKSVTFLLSTNFSEVLVLLGALLLNLPLPLLPLHILLINLLTDSFPALALAKEPAEKKIMEEKPRPVHEGFLHGTIPTIIWIGIGITILTLALFSYGLASGLSEKASQTLAFVTLSMGELIIVFSLRSTDSIFSKTYFQNMNGWILAASLGGILITIFLIFSPLSSLLSLEPFPPVFWILSLAGGGIILLISEVQKAIQTS